MIGELLFRKCEQTVVAAGNRLRMFRRLQYGKFVALMLLTCILAHGPSSFASDPDPAISAGGKDQGSDSELSSYLLGAGDVISIRVFGEDDLTKEKVKLTDAGTIFYPVLGEIKVLGMTVGNLQRIVADGLRGRFLVNPRVSVNVDEYRPFYINGMVQKTGAYAYQPGLTVRKAAALAGGFLERASTSKITIIREGDPEQRSQKADLNTDIGPGDVISVGESFF